ncbi:MbtH family protein [Brachybacterium alimentarium]|uniref:MbtH family protein n=1 Tax=Brachybacterium alimentarium TaxID=47845 RepID=UPI000DF19C0F|nr:MbtH family protein [Brachybacterium alimentarium]RCS75883.1 MbtH family protein [Brachybacterium alimentarium]
MMNPFDDTDATFRVLVNERGQHSLWPDSADLPRGWVVVFGPDDHAACLRYVDASWYDITPRRLDDGARAAS